MEIEALICPYFAMLHTGYVYSLQDAVRNEAHRSRFDTVTMAQIRQYEEIFTLIGSILDCFMQQREGKT
jgi:hypothetical protein